MAPVAAKRRDVDSGKSHAKNESTAAESSTKTLQPGKRKKRASAKSSQAATKRQKSAAGKNTAPRRRMSKKKQQEVSQTYQKLVKSRKIFEGSPGDGDTSEDPSPDPEQDSSLQTFIDSRPEVDEDVVKKDHGLIKNALEKCAPLVDPRSPINGKYKLQSIETPLTPLQFATLGWMVWKEKTGTLPRGGIVAHDMGVGKTLMALAVMVANKTSLDRKKSNDASTLVVVPSYAVIDHWLDECTRHAPEIFPEESMARYKRLKQFGTVETFKRYKIVFATYGELSRDVPDGYKEPNSPDKELDPETEERMENYMSRPIFEAMWYRIVLDEAHTIRNKVTKASLAIRRLQKRNAWAISGTLAANGKQEMFPYLNFLGVRGCKYQSTFLEEYFPKEEPSLEFQEIMTRVMISRKFNETFLGEKILSLPDHHACTESLKPTAKETVILNFIRTKAREKAEKSIEKSIDASEDSETALSKAWSSITSLLHLYRFAGIHPFLIESSFMSEFSIKDNERLIEELRAVKDNEGDNGESDAPKVLSIDKILEVALQHKKLKGAKCCKCHERCTENRGVTYKLPCGHFCCSGCLSINAKGDLMTFRCRAKGCLQESRWGERKIQPSLYQPEEAQDDDSSGSDSEYDASESESEEDRGKGKRGKGKALEKRKKSKLGPGSDFLGKEPQLESGKQRFLACMDKLSKKSGVIPSAKILRVQELLKAWKQTSPDDKIIIFTQFMVVAKLLGRVARVEGIKFLYYTGDLSESARAQALETFKTDERPKILITSLKCGGQALNITCANRVILMELWWNSPAEEQAFARVHRMGQEKEVHVVRLRCKGTREDGILKMQTSKVKDVQNCTLSNQMTKANHSKHTLFSVIGLPVIKDGIIVDLERPRKAYLGDTSDESDGEDGDAEGKLQHVEELHGEDKIGDKAEEKGGDEAQEGLVNKETDNPQEKIEVQKAAKDAIGEKMEAKEETTVEKEGQKDRNEVSGGDTEAEKDTVFPESNEGTGDDAKAKKNDEDEAEKTPSAEKDAVEGFGAKKENDEVKIQEDAAEAMDVDVEVVPDEIQGIEATNGIERETSVATDRNRMVGDENRKDANKAETEKISGGNDTLEVEMDLD